MKRILFVTLMCFGFLQLADAQKGYKKLYEDSLEYYQNLLEKETDTINRIKIISKQAACYKKLARFGDAIKPLYEAIELSDNLLTANKLQSDLYFETASCWAGLGSYNKAVAMQGEGLQKLTTVGSDDRNYSFYYEFENQIINGIEYLHKINSSRSIQLLKNIRDIYSGVYQLLEDETKKSSPIDSLKLLNLWIDYGYVEFMDNDGICQMTLGGTITDIEEHYGVNNSLYIKAMELFALTSYSYGDYYEAFCHQKEVLPIVMNYYGEKSPEYMKSMRSMSKYSSATGNYKDALEYGKNALDLCSELYGEDNIIYAETLENLALCYVEKGDYHEGMYLLNKVKAIKEEICGDDNIKYNETINNIADVNFKAGNYENAIQLSRQSLELEKLLAMGEEYNYYTVSTQEKLCDYLSAAGQYKETLESAEKVIELQDSLQRVLDPTWGRDELNEYSYYKSHYNMYLKMAYCYLHLDEPSKALELIQHIQEKKLPYKELSDIANIYAGFGDYNKAIEICNQSLEIIKDEIGETHPYYANSLYNLATYEFNNNNCEKALTDITEYYEKAKNTVLANIANMSSKERTRLWQKFANGFTNTIPQIAVSVKDKNSGELLYNTALFCKGILLNTSIGMVQLLTESGNKELIDTYQQLLLNKSILNKYYEHKMNGLNIDSIAEVINEQESELMRKSRVYGDCTKSLRTDWKQVRNSLRTNDIAIEFVSFDSNDGERMYLALAVKNGDSTPTAIQLCTEKQIKDINSEDYYNSDSLYNLIWKPLGDKLRGVKRIYFSPSGILNNIAIEYLPVSKNKMVSEQYTIYRLSSTREIVSQTPNRKEVLPKAVLYGGLNYDVDMAEIKKEETITENDNMERHFMERAIADSISLRGGIQYLEGTKVEVEEINTTLQENNVDCSVFSDNAGTEESFKNLSGQNIGILHVATHGFYFPESRVNTSKRLPFMILDADKSDKEDKSLSRSGLLLTGAGNVFANKPIPANQEDGVLTAKEISNLDLRSLNLVVLSACQSGLGDILGDDVFGLQRGFKIAGAKSLVMSLWKVNDEATFMLMSEFYANIAKGQDINEAFRNSQTTLRTINDGEFSDPKYWAAFILLDVFDYPSKE